MIKFVKEIDKNNKFDNTEITFLVNSATCIEICEEFQAFLRACGFHEDTIKHCFNIDNEE
jgi:hypothetical protein